MRLFLARINDRSYGFTVVAVVACDEDDAKAILGAKHHCWFGDWWSKPSSCAGLNHAELRDSTDNVKRGASVEMEYEE